MAKFNYNVAMSWTSKGLCKQLEDDIRRDYPWLFQEYRAVVLPAKPYKQVLDYANVTVEVSELLLQFSRGCDEFHVSVAPTHSPNDWLEFGQAIDLARNLDLSPKRPIEVSDFQRLFEANLGHLKVYFSKEEYDRSKRWRNLPINLAKNPNRGSS
ncbi:MAG: hypothetical protein WAK20_09035 [Candidatus Acidiferrum sp.]